jgi:hypothetical protein
MFQVFVLNVLAVSNVCCKCVYLYVAYVALDIHVCCKCMFQMLQLFQAYVVSVLSGCCICYSAAHTYMLQTYAIKVSFVLDICCSKCFMLQELHE